MSELHTSLNSIDISLERQKQQIVYEIGNKINEAGYSIAETDDSRPWGAFFRFKNSDADRFVEEFFPGVEPSEARLGNPDAELSPKILLVSPAQRLSWQYHDRRAERWTFLTPGGYYKSPTDSLGNEFEAELNEQVQFEKGERHRLVAALGHYTIVAEIWQHTDPANPSNEDDIVRVQDDYRR